MSSPFSYGGIMHHTLCYTSSRFLDTKFFYNIPSRKVAIANSAWKQCQSKTFISRDRVLSATYFLPCYASFITPLWGQNLSYTWLWIYFSFWTITPKSLSLSRVHHWSNFVTANNIQWSSFIPLLSAGRINGFVLRTMGQAGCCLGRRRVM